MVGRARLQEGQRHRWLGVLIVLLVVVGVFGYIAWVNASNDNDGGRVQFVDH
jgi:hypothetical protein